MRCNTRSRTISFHIFSDFFADTFAFTDAKLSIQPVIHTRPILIVHTSSGTRPHTHLLQCRSICEHAEAALSGLPDLPTIPAHPVCASALRRLAARPPSHELLQHREPASRRRRLSVPK